MIARKIGLLAASGLRKPLKTMDAAIENAYRVLPTDLDENLHMNNARYLRHMELGRTDMMMRSGFFKYALTRGLQLVIANQTVVYRRSLDPMQRFTVGTKIMMWSDHAILFQHVFRREGQICATALVDCRALQRGKRVSLAAAVAELGIDGAANFEKPDHLVQKSAELVKGLLKSAETF